MIFKKNFKKDSKKISTNTKKSSLVLGQPVCGKSALAVQTTGLTRTFQQGKNAVAALSGVDLEIRSGEFVAVMGASGSGKSTLLHLLAGLIRPSSGGVAIEGNDLNAMSDHSLTLFRRRRIGFVFQNFNLIPYLTAEENVGLPLVAEGGKSAATWANLEKIFTELEITSQRFQRPDTLSGGQQQRVALARALSMDPAILLADEPTGNLDSVNSRNICQILHRLCQNDHRTIALVTHDPGVAIWAQRLLILRDGKILADLDTHSFADPHELAASYQEIVREGEEQ